MSREKLRAEMELVKTKEFDPESIEMVSSALATGQPVMAIGLIAGWLAQNTGNLKNGETHKERLENGSGTDHELTYEDIVSCCVFDAYEELKKKIISERKEHRQLMVDAACEFYFNSESEGES